VLLARKRAASRACRTASSRTDLRQRETVNLILVPIGLCGASHLVSLSHRPATHKRGKRAYRAVRGQPDILVPPTSSQSVSVFVFLFLFNPRCGVYGWSLAIASLRMARQPKDSDPTMDVGPTPPTFPFGLMSGTHAFA